MEHNPQTSRTHETNNLLVLDDDDATSLSQQSISAIHTLRTEIASYEQQGEEGLAKLIALLNALGEAVFATADEAIARQQEADSDSSHSLIQYGSRNLDVILRALNDSDDFQSAVRYIMREAPEDIIVAHGLAAIDVMRTASGAHLRQRGEDAYRACMEIAHIRGGARRLQKAFDAASHQDQQDDDNGNHKDREAGETSG